MWWFYKDNGLTWECMEELKSARPWLLTERNPEIPAKVIDESNFS